MSDYVEIIGTDELEDDSMTMRELDGRPLLIARTGGAFYVANNTCPHLGGFLAHGVLEGTIVTCPRHHSQFDLTDGHVVRWTDWSDPLREASELLRHRRPLPVYEVRVEDGRLLVGPQKEPPPTE